MNPAGEFILAILVGIVGVLTYIVILIAVGWTAYRIYMFFRRRKRCHSVCGGTTFPALL